jgi:glycosyltransferase involved in cell wall biosynthesis
MSSRALDTKTRLKQKLSQRKGKKICLAMIVKNESKNMVRLLNTLKNIIDFISIDDTGSTDNTKEIIETWGRENNIQTTVHSEPFKNFSHNRTNSVKNAIKTYPAADYILLSDADFVWEIDGFNKNLLTEASYTVLQYNSTISYWNIRILSAKNEWNCVGVTHEYWDTPTKVESSSRGVKVSTLKIKDIGDGGCKSDKYERDERLLLGGLEDSETPSDLKTRYKFYLAQTYKDMGKKEESIKWYLERIADGGWEEEVYYSYLSIGDNFENLYWRTKSELEKIEKSEKGEKGEKEGEKGEKGEKEKLKEKLDRYEKEARKFYYKSYEYRSTRAEPLAALCGFCRKIGDHRSTYTYAKLGSKIPYPKGDLLFINHNVYDYVFDNELSIVCYYVGEKKEGAEICERLLLREDLPEHIETLVKHNAKFYL